MYLHLECFKQNIVPKNTRKEGNKIMVKTVGEMYSELTKENTRFVSI